MCSGADGAFTILARIPDGPSVTFQLNVGPAPAGPLTELAGDNQTVAREGYRVPGGIARFAPLQVKVSDSRGTAMPGAQVTFTAQDGPPSMAIQLLPQEEVRHGGGRRERHRHPACDERRERRLLLRRRTVLGDRRQRRRGGQLDLHVVPAPRRPLSEQLDRDRRGRSPRPVRRASDPRINVPGGVARFAPLTIAVADRSNQPIAGAVVAFAAGAIRRRWPCNCIRAAPHRSAWRRTRTAVATLNVMLGSGVVCYYAEGPFSVVATVSGGPSATFDLTVGG